MPDRLLLVEDTSSLSMVYEAVLTRAGHRVTCAANLAVVGAEPLGVTNCLNFGNPEKPGVAWQLGRAVEGLAEACRALEAPVVGGNVSLYNETPQGPIYPTPVVGMVGELPDPEKVAGENWQEGDAVALVGPFDPSLAGSELEKQRGELGKGLPVREIGPVKTAIELVRDAVRSGGVRTATDVSDGGLSTALAELSISSGIGFEGELSALIARRDCSEDDALFGEAATETAVPDRAHWLRALMAELERLANHCGDIGAICNDAAFALMHAHCAVLRERVLRASAACFGHRLLMDRIVPGGVETDLPADGVRALRALVAEFRRQFPPLVDLYDDTASLQDRTVGTGFVRPALIRQFGCGGTIGRAGGRAFDARRQPGYPPYGQLEYETPIRTDSDVNARVWLRIREVEQSLSLIEQMLERLPSGSVRGELNRPGQPCEGVALVEGFRGDVLVWLRLAADGTVARCHPRDPSWFQWPLLEAAIESNIVADFPLCNKSFNCSYSGHDL